MEKHRELILIGKKIRYLRKSKGYSQDDFAAYVDISRAFYGRIERGEQNLSIMNLIKIAKALNVELGQLFPPLAMLKSNDNIKLDELMLLTGENDSG